MTNPSSIDVSAAAVGVGRGSVWVAVWGVLLIIAGILAVLMPEIAALATVLVLGWLLILAGIFEIIDAIYMRKRSGFGWILASGILTLVLGFWILARPAAGVASLALLVAVFLFVAGIARVALAARLRPLRGSGWVMFNGLLSIAVAILIAIGWPRSSVPFIGLLAGLSMITSGIWRIALRRTMFA